MSCIIYYIHVGTGDAGTFESFVTVKKVLVNIPNLLALAKHKCHRVGCYEPITKCTPVVSGCSVKLEMTCSAKHLMEWHSCPNITSKAGGSVPSNNILQAAGILFCGSHFAKYFMLNRICHIHGISESTFYRYQKYLLAPAVEQYWQSQQQDVVSKLSGKSLILSGDGRCDSPGKSAKFCSYTLMDTATELVVHTNAVDKREVGGKSPNMEREGLFRGLTEVTGAQNLKVREIVTDASTSVKTMLGKLHVQCIFYLILTS